MDPRAVLQDCPVLETMKIRGGRKGGGHFEDKATYCDFLVFCLSSAFVTVYPPPFPHTPICAIYMYIINAGMQIHEHAHTCVPGINWHACIHNWKLCGSL